MNAQQTAEIFKLIGLAVPVALLLVTVTIGYITRAVIFTRLIRWATRTGRQVDDIVIEAVRDPFMIWFLMLGLYLFLETSKLPKNYVYLFDKVLQILGILSVTCALANLSGSLIKHYARHIESVLPVTSLTHHMTNLLIFGVGALVMLSSIGISVTPILATLGVGGLAVALALQDTLSNLFSGFYIMVSGRMKIGDYVKLDSGEEGYITDITWRLTEITMLSNNLIAVPNNKLMKAVVTDYSLPSKQTAVLINLGVHYKSDLEKVERVTCEVAKEVMRTVPGGVPDFEPFIRYGSFGDYSITMTVIMSGRTFVDQYLIKHEFIKRLQSRYAKEGIVIPYPIRAIKNLQE